MSVAIMATFSCEDCGSVSIILPADLVSSARVRCSGCGRDHGCWSQFKEDAARIIRAESRSSADEEAGTDRSRHDRCQITHH